MNEVSFKDVALIILLALLLVSAFVAVSYRSQVQSLSNELRKSQLALSEKSSYSKQLEDEISKLRDELSKTRAEIESLRDQLKRYESEESELRTENSHLKDVITRLQEEVSYLRSRSLRDIANVKINFLLEKEEKLVFEGFNITIRVFGKEIVIYTAPPFHLEDNLTIAVGVPVIGNGTPMTIKADYIHYLPQKKPGGVITWIWIYRASKVKEYLVTGDMTITF